MLNSGTLNSSTLNSDGGTVLQARASAPTPLGEPAGLAAIHVQARASAATPLAEPAGVALSSTAALAAAPTPLAEPAALATATEYAAKVSAPGPLTAPRVVAETDWSGLIDAITTRQFYICILTGGPDGLPDLRMRISSWQATVQNDRASYLQAVVPGVLPLIDDISARPGGDIVLISGVELQSGAMLEQVMAQAPLQNFRYDRGPTNSTGTLSGYATLFGESAPNASARQLQNVRSLSSDTSGYRVRADIDLMLRPGRQALAAGQALDVAYINYYANKDDAYMDVGERSDG